MALKGNLQDFPLTDIFQLIGQQQKSGALYIRQEGKVLRIIFQDGSIVLGNAKGSTHLLLGTILKKSEVITPETLQTVLDEQRKTKKSLGDILLKKGHLSSELFRTYIKIQLDEILSEAFSWESGSYEFIAEKISFKADFFHMQRAEGVLMEQFQRKDEWPQINSKIGSTQSVYSLLTTELPPSLAKSSNAASILKLINGTRTIEEVAYKSKVGVFETAKIFQDFLQNDLIKKQEKKTFTTVKYRTFSPPSLFIALTFGFVVSAIFFAPWSHFRSSQANFSPTGQINPHPNLNTLRIQSERFRIENLIMAYHLNNGFYPRTINDILKDKNISSEWAYRVNSNGFQLTFRSKR